MFWVLVGGLAYAFWRNGDALMDVSVSALLFVCLSTISAFDARYFLIPNTFVGVTALAGITTWDISEIDMVADRLAAAALGYVVIYGVEKIYLAIRGTAGVGRGDAKLLAAGGVWVGLEGVPSTIFLASLSGLVSAAVMRLQRRELAGSTAIPFGPHLAASIWLVWLLGPLRLTTVG